MREVGEGVGGGIGGFEDLGDLANYVTAGDGEAAGVGREGRGADLGGKRAAVGG